MRAPARVADRDPARPGTSREHDDSSLASLRHVIDALDDFVAGTGIDRCEGAPGRPRALPLTLASAGPSYHPD